MAPKAPAARPPIVVATRGAKEARGAREGPGGCQLPELFQLLGKAYVMDLLYAFHVEARPLRFVDLQRRLGISPNTLSDRLKELVEAGFLTRTAFSEIPPRVDYEATAKAKELRTVFRSLGQWAGCHDLNPVEVAAKANKASSGGRA